MQYLKPILHALDTTIAVAACTPAPYTHEQCKANSQSDVVVDPTNSKGEGIIDGGIYLGLVNGTNTCLLVPDNPDENLAQAPIWLNCVIAGGGTGC